MISVIIGVALLFFTIVGFSRSLSGSWAWAFKATAIAFVITFFALLSLALIASGLQT